MPMFTHYVVLDCEVANSPKDCRYCGLPQSYWDGPGEQACPAEDGHASIGWSNKSALGLSIGCAYDSLTQRTTVFDGWTLEATMRQWVEERPLLVTYNGLTFDLPLLRGILRRHAETMPHLHESQPLTELCDAFKLLSAEGYDVLQAIWAADPVGKFAKGINSLDAVAQANGLGSKTGTGAEAPRLWAAGRHAEVINYCAWDVELTHRLFQKVLNGGLIARSDGSALVLPFPNLALEAWRSL